MRSSAWGCRTVTPTPTPADSTINVTGKRKRRDSKDNDLGHNKKKLKSLSKGQCKRKGNGPKNGTTKAKPKENSQTKPEEKKTTKKDEEMNFFDTAFGKLSSQIESMELQLTQRMDHFEKSLEDKVTKNVTEKLTNIVNSKVEESVGDMKRTLDKEIGKVKNTVSDLKKKSVSDTVKAVNATKESSAACSRHERSKYCHSKSSYQ